MRRVVAHVSCSPFHQFIFSTISRNLSSGTKRADEFIKDIQLTGRLDLLPLVTASQDQDVILDTWLRYGRLSHGLSSCNKLTTSRQLNAWTRFWLLYGHAQVAYRLISQHPQLVTSETRLIQIEDALAKSNYALCNLLRRDMLKAANDSEHGHIDYLELISKDLCKKRMVDALERHFPPTKNHSQVVLDSLVECFAATGQQDKLQAVLREITTQKEAQSNGASMNHQFMSAHLPVSTCNAMLRGLEGALGAQQMDQIVDLVKDQGHPDTFHAMLRCLLGQQRFDEMLSLLWQMGQMHLNVGDDSLPENSLETLAIDTLLYPWHIIDLFQLCNRWGLNHGSDTGHVKALLARFVLEHKLSMPPAYYNLLLQDTKTWAQTRDILEYMVEQEISPDLHTINVLLEKCIDIADMTKTMSLLKQGFPNVDNEENLMIPLFVKETMLKAFMMPSKDHDGYRVIRGTPVNAITREPLSYHKDFIDNEQKSPAFIFPTDWQPVRLLTNLKERFQSLYPPGLNQLILTPTLLNETLVYLLRTEQLDIFWSFWKRIIDGICVFPDNPSSILVPNSQTLTVLIKACLLLEAPEHARAQVELFKRFGVQPTPFQLALINHHYCRRGRAKDAHDWISKVERFYAVKPNYVFLAALLYAHWRAREYGKVLEVMRRIKDQGFALDTEASNYIMGAMFGSGKFNDGVSFFLGEHPDSPFVPLNASEIKKSFERVKRNTHTFEIFVTNALARREFDLMFSLLDQSLSSISHELSEDTLEDARFVHRIFQHAWSMDKPVMACRALELMFKHCIQVDGPALPLIGHLFNLYLQAGRDEKTRNLPGYPLYNHIDVVSDSNLPFSKMTPLQCARAIYEKCAIDQPLDVIEDDDKSSSSSVVIQYMANDLIKTYQVLEMFEEVITFEHFMLKKLPVLRQLWTGTGPILQSVLVQMDQMDSTGTSSPMRLIDSSIKQKKLVAAFEETDCVNEEEKNTFSTVSNSKLSRAFDALDQMLPLIDINDKKTNNFIEGEHEPNILFTFGSKIPSLNTKLFYKPLNLITDQRRRKATSTTNDRDEMIAVDSRHSEQFQLNKQLTKHLDETIK